MNKSKTLPACISSKNILKSKSDQRTSLKLILALISLTILFVLFENDVEWQMNVENKDLKLAAYPDTKNQQKNTTFDQDAGLNTNSNVFNNLQGHNPELETSIQNSVRKMELIKAEVPNIFIQRAILRRLGNQDLKVEHGMKNLHIFSEMIPGENRIRTNVRNKTVRKHEEL